MTVPIQRSFAGGELAPALYARTDTTKYQTGLRTCRNGLILRHGGWSNRPGTSYVGAGPAGANKVRLIPFVFNSDQTYALELSAGKIRVIKRGSYVVGGTFAASNVFINTVYSFSDVRLKFVALPAYYGYEVTMGTTAGFSSGDVVLVQLNGDSSIQQYRVANVISGTKMTLYKVDGTYYPYPIAPTIPPGTFPGRIMNQSTNYGIITMASTASFSAGDTFFWTDSQNNQTEYSVLSITDGTHLRFTALNGSKPVPAYLDGTMPLPGTIQKNFRIDTTYTEDEIFELNYVQSADVITLVHHNHAPAELARLADDNWTLTPVTFAPAISAPTGLSVDDGQGNGATYLGTQKNKRVYYAVTAVKAESGEESVGSITGPYSGPGFPSDPDKATGTYGYTVHWSSVAGASEYNIYRSDDGAGYGFIGTSTGTSFGDRGITPDATLGPPTARNPFSGAGNYPSTVSYVQQRIVYAATDNQPETSWLSKSGNYHNFTTSNPLQDDDAITFTLAGRQVNEIKYWLDVGSALILTSGGEWSIQGDGQGVLRPTAINARQQSYNGSSNLPPLIIGGNALYVQARGSIVRDFSFDYQVDGYRGNDLTIFSAHLFDAYNLVDWTFQQIPQSIAWLARSDGILLGLTYVREQQIFAWHRHDFSGGLVESVCALPEGIEDALYLVINRSGTRYVERLNTRQIDDIKDAIFVDSSVTYDGRNTDLTNTITVSTYNGGDLTHDSQVSLEAVNNTFAASDVGNEIHITGPDGIIYQFEIEVYATAKIVRARPNKTVPNGFLPTANWVRAVDAVIGLGHLEGKDVSVLGDGFVVANPNDSEANIVTVIAGGIQLPRCYGVIHVGLPIVADLETLDIDTPQGETLQSKGKLVTRVNVMLEKSRGFWVGPMAPEDQDNDQSILSGMEEFKIRRSENYDSPVSLLTGVASVVIRPEWNSNGRVFIRQIDPLPLTILSVAPAAMISQGQGL